LLHLGSKTFTKHSRIPHWRPATARHNQRIEPLLTIGIIAAIATGIAVIIALRAEAKSFFASKPT
jgi:hypothetical protein